MKLSKVRGAAGERGQAAVFITILLMFAFIALAALAIDGGHLYVVRRDLQNMADAACLAAATELALGGDESGAYQAAVDYVLANGGTPELFADPPVGEGAGLTSGIVVTGKGIRVALQTVVDTYFTMIFNRQGAGVGARAHCNAQAGGGPLPIAVRRYEYVEGDPEEQLDLLANKHCQPDTNCHYPQDANDPNRSCDVKELPGYYSEKTLFCEITRTEWIPISGTLWISETGNIDCDLPPQDDVLDGACVLGVHPETNDGTEKFSGFVALDIRNVTGGCPPEGKEGVCGIQYYNGASGQDATNKLLASEWFCNTWTGWRPPELGDQLAFLPGVSARFSPKTMSDCGWEVGEQFVAVVYSGYVWDTPDFRVRIEPLVNQVEFTDEGDIQTATYTVYLEKPNQSKPWEGAANFELDAFLMVEDDPDNPITPTIGLPTSVWFPWEDDVITVPMTITATDYVSTTEYLTAVTVQARDATFTNLKRWASTNFMYGDVTGDFTLAADSLEIVAEPGDHLNIPLTTRGFGFSAEKPNLAPIEGAPCPPASFAWNGLFSSDPESGIEIKDGISSSEVFPVDILEEEGLTGQYDLCLTVGEAPGPVHTVRLTVAVGEPTEGGTPTKFVIVEGFAPFEISYIDENDVLAFAVGPIVHTLEGVTTATRSALLPW